MDSRSITLAGDKEVGRTATPSPRPSFEKESKTDLDDTTDQENGSITNGASSEEEAEGQYPEGLRLAFIVIALLLSIFLVSYPLSTYPNRTDRLAQVSLDMTIVATAIPKITDEFQGLDLVGWYGSAFFLTLGAFQSTWGKGYKYFPLKITFLTSIFIFEIGSLICGESNTSQH